MAKPKGRPKGERDEVSVKLDRTLAGMVKALAQGRGVTVGEFLTRTLESPIKREYAALLRDLDKGGK